MTAYRIPTEALDEPGIKGVVKQLTDDRVRIERCEAELKTLRRFRKGLVKKLLNRGFSTRYIGSLTGLSSRGVSDINREHNN